MNNKTKKRLIAILDEFGAETYMLGAKRNEMLRGWPLIDPFSADKIWNDLAKKIHLANKKAQDELTALFSP